jgi:hypothetical protein
MPATVGCPHGGDSQPGAHRPSWEVADIFRLYGDASRQPHAVSAAQPKVLDAIMAWRTAQLGGHAERCPQCGVERYASSACRHRHGPTCQTWATAQWGAAQRAELRPPPSCHTVLTVPHALNALILDNKRRLLTRLCRTVSQTLLQFGQQHLGGQLGAPRLLHTWEQTLHAHFPLHCLVPAGALAEAGPRWVPTHPRFLLPGRALRTVCRAKVLVAFPQAYHKAALRCAQGSAPCDSSTGFPPLLDQRYTQAWVVYAQRPGAGPTQVRDYLGRSIHRVAMANHRLLEVRDGCGRCTYRHRRPGNRVHPRTREAQELIRRCLLPIVPHGCQRLRPGGFLANRCKARALRQCRALLGPPIEPPPREKPNAVEGMRQRTGIDLTQWPQGGHGPLMRSPRPPLTVRAPSQETPLKVPPWASS